MRELRNYFLVAGAVVILVTPIPATAASARAYSTASPGQIAAPWSNPWSTSQDGLGQGVLGWIGGLPIVGPETIQFRPANEDEAVAFNHALNLALANRNSMGYPWIETDRQVLELRASNEKGMEAAAAALADMPDTGLATRLLGSAASIADLDKIADEATRLVEAGVPNAQLIWMTEPDHRSNRVIITVSRADKDLLAALASRFGTDLVAVRVLDAPAAESTGRNSDAPSFWGGAYITTSAGLACTTGFAWSVSGKSGMLTAGHCIWYGGYVSYPNYPNAGWVTQSSRENWNRTSGTQYFAGQSVYRGDLALIEYYSLGSAPYIYSGAPGTSSASAVKAMASRWSQIGDAACVNGVVTGEWCGMVTGTGLNAWYLVDGVNVWARHVVRAEALGNTCPTHGDSGAPVYRKVSGGVAAVGIHSGSAPLVVSCTVWFTDIWDAYYGLPGTVKVN